METDPYMTDDIYATITSQIVQISVYYNNDSRIWEIAHSVGDIYAYVLMEDRRHAIYRLGAGIRTLRDFIPLLTDQPGLEIEASENVPLDTPLREVPLSQGCISFYRRGNGTAACSVRWDA